MGSGGYAAAWSVVNVRHVLQPHAASSQPIPIIPPQATDASCVPTNTHASLLSQHSVCAEQPTPSRRALPRGHNAPVRPCRRAPPPLIRTARNTTPRAVLTDNRRGRRPHRTPGVGAPTGPPNTRCLAPRPRAAAGAAPPSAQGGAGGPQVAALQRCARDLEATLANGDSAPEDSKGDAVDDIAVLVREVEVLRARGGTEAVVQERQKRIDELRTKKLAGKPVRLEQMCQAR